MPSKPPTAKQLAYLRALSKRAGQTFAMPRTRQDASAEIRRLKAAPVESRLERKIERDEIADAVGTGAQDSVRVHRRSQRVWLICDLEAAVMTTPTVTGNSEEQQRRRRADRSSAGTAPPPASNGCSMASASRTVVRVTDVPVERPGRAYLVERGLEEDGYAALLALVADYLETANRLGVPPMSTTVFG